MFELFSIFHIAILIGIAISGIGLGCLLRKYPQKSRTAFRLVGSCILALELLWYAHVLSQPWSPWPGGLPLHLCDISLWLTVVVCLKKWQGGFDVVYYWGLAGTTMALLTPDVQGASLNYPTIQFFISHGLVVAALLSIAISSWLRPGMKSAITAFLWLNGYAALLAAFNAATGTNYMFLMEKPYGTSPLDWFGPWPWYLVVADIVGAGMFWGLWRIGKNKLPMFN